MGGYGQGVSDALYGGFEQGMALRQQRKEQDFQDTANQLFNNRSALQQKLASLKDANGNPLPGYDDAMKDLTANETAIRQHWHPDNNPGMLQKFGHMITDHLGITDPDARAQQQAQQQQAKIQGDQGRATMLASATPLSPAQTALMNVKTQGQVQHAQLEQDVQNWKEANPDYTPAQEAQFRKQLTDAILLGRRWNPLYERGKFQVMSGTDKDGKEIQWLHDTLWNTNTDLSGGPLDDSFFEGLSNVHPVTTTPKPPGSSMGSALAIGLRAYARAHGILDAQGNPDASRLTPDQVNYVMATQAQAKVGGPTSTTSNVLKQDAQGRWVPVTEHNTKTPGMRALKDPLGPASSNWIAEADAATPPPAAAGAPATPGAVSSPTPAAGTSPKTGLQPTPQQLRDEAAKRNPKVSTSGANSSVNVGQPVLQGRTPAGDAALKAVDTAEGAYSEVLRAAHSTNPVDSQGVVLSWLRGKVNRVTATEIAAVKNLGGIFDKFDGNVSSIEHGTMTPKQISWFVKNAKDNLDTARKVASKYTNPNGQTDSGGGDWRSRAVAH